MRLSILDRKLLRDLRAIKGQALAIALVIAAGVTTVVMAIGTQVSLGEIRRAYYERYRFADIFAEAERVPLDVAGRVAGIEGVAAVEPRIIRGALLDLPALPEPVRALLHSLPDSGEPAVNALLLREGRLPEPGRADEILVNEAFALAHGFHPGDRLDAVVNGRWRPLAIVGIAMSPEFVYVIGPGSLVPDDRRYAILWMGRAAMEAAFDYEGAFNALALSLRRETPARPVIDAIDALLAPYGGRGAYDRSDQLSDSFLKSDLEQLGTLALLLPPVFLLVAAYLLAMVMNRLVETERAEIGLAKAFGYTDRELGLHYLKFALAITAGGILIGFVSGTLMGRSITALYTDYYKFPYLTYVIDGRVYLLAAAASLAAGVLGVMGAVRRTLALPPAIAMRAPPPARYAQGALERLGLTGGLPPLWRMALRHVTRFPVRAGLAVLGVSASIAVLVMSFFFGDSIETMIDTFFFETERQDATVQFGVEHGEEVARALAGLPGVRHVELRRHVATRLTHGRHTERIAITGLPQQSVFTRLTRVDGGPLDLPPRGLVLSRALADKLDARPGSMIDLAFLQGRRGKARVPVIGIADTLVGLTAYMERRALNRLLGEGAVADAAYLGLDPAREEAFYAAVKETPAIAGLSVKRAAYGEFRRILDESFLTMIAFYVTLAMVIAIGVVYNNARITLAERSRELASLRVLGFHEAEVAEILLVELGVLTLVALPVGCLLGIGLVHLMAELFSTDLYRIPRVIHGASFGMALTFVLVASALAGLAVVRRVRDFDLVSVLKTRE